MRIAERYRPGVTPIASLKVRQKWNLLTIALLAISARDNGSLYFSYMNLIARSWALFIYLLSRLAQEICGFGCERSESPAKIFCYQTLTITMHHDPRTVVVAALWPSCLPLDSALTAPLGTRYSNSK